MSDYLLVLAVIIAAIAAGAAWKAAKESQKTSLAHFILEDVGTYGSPEMLRAIMELIHYWNEHKKNSAQRFGTLKNSQKREDYLKIKDVDEARRRFTKYFTLTKVLLKHDLINKELGKELRPEYQHDFYLKFVKPLEKKIKLATGK